MLVLISMFSVIIYIVYILLDVIGFSVCEESWVLLFFGVGIIVGGLVGGKLVDWKLMLVMCGVFLCIVIVLGLFFFISYYKWLMLVMMFVWGVFVFVVVFGV